MKSNTGSSVPVKNNGNSHSKKSSVGGVVNRVTSLFKQVRSSDKNDIKILSKIDILIWDPGGAIYPMYVGSIHR